MAIEKEKKSQINKLNLSVNAFIQDNFGQFPVISFFSLDRASASITLKDCESDTEADTAKLEPKDMKQLLDWITENLDNIRAEQNAEFDSEDDNADELAEEEWSASWSIKMYDNGGHESRLSGDGLKLPPYVSQLFWKLSDYFEDTEDGFDFMGEAFGCDDLITLNQLVCELTVDSVVTGDDHLLGSAYMDILTYRDSVMGKDEDKKRSYHIHSGAAASLYFLSSFVPTRHSEQEKVVQTGRERLEAFNLFVQENILPPVGNFISVSEIDMVMNAVSKKYPLWRRMFVDSKLTILRLNNTHKEMNSMCNASHKIGDATKFSYELYLFHTKDFEQGHPVYIFLHELGHILQIEAAHDPSLVPESFIKFSNDMTGKELTQGEFAPELFADAFAMAMMQTFGWKEYDTFDIVSDSVKELFKHYMEQLMVRMEQQQISK